MIWSRLTTWLQFDKSLSISLLARVWQAISGPVTMSLLIGTLSLHEQGLFNGIMHIAAIQPLFELGFGSVLIAQTANAVGRQRLQLAELGRRGAAADAEAAVARGQAELLGLQRAAMQWFLVMAALYAVCGGWLGWRVLDGSGTQQLDWRWPLGLSIALAAVSVAVAPRAYMLEGAGEREYVYQWRLAQTVSGSLVMWSMLWLGLKLWAVVAVFAIAACFQVALACGPRYRRLMGSRTPGAAANLPEYSTMSWLARLAPLQWRAALSSAAHYLATQTIFLWVINYHGATVAAPLGLTLQIATAIQALALAWAQTKFPLIAQHQAEQEREQAGTLWRQTTLVSGGLLLLGMLALATLVAVLPWAERGWERRFIEPWLIMVLAVGYLANHGVALQAFYVLARGAKPLVGAAVSGLMFTAVVVWLAARQLGVEGSVCGYTLALTGVALPLHTWAYLQFRR